MKIVLVNSTISGGAATACKRLKSALLNHKQNISIFTKKEYYQKKNHYLQILSNWLSFLFFFGERISFFRFVKEKKYRFAFSMANCGADIASHHAINQSDIIHLHWINQGFVSLQGLQQILDLDKPIVWTLHDMWAFTGGCHYSGLCDHFVNECGECFMLKQPSIQDISHQLWLQKKAIFSSAKNNITFVACSQWMQNQAKKSSLINRFDIVHIPNAIDTKLFKPYNKAETKKRLGLSIHKTIILFAAANVHDYRKGFGLLQEAIQIFKSLYPLSSDCIEFAICGKSQVDLSLSFFPFHAVQFGNVQSEEEMVALYNGADFFITPAMEDNLPNTIMEALACGTPVIAYPVGGIPEMIDHLQNGYLIPDISAKSLAESIHWAINVDKENDSLAKNARAKVLENYNEEIIATKHLSLYNNLFSDS